MKLKIQRTEPFVIWQHFYKRPCWIAQPLGLATQFSVSALDYSYLPWSYQLIWPLNKYTFLNDNLGITDWESNETNQNIQHQRLIKFSIRFITEK